MIVLLVLLGWAACAGLAYVWQQHVNNVDFGGDYRTFAIVVAVLGGPIAVFFALGYWIGHKVQ